MATADHVKARIRSHVDGDDTPFCHAEIAMACEEAAKNAILDHTTAVRDADLVAALTERRSTQRGAAA